MSNLTLFVAIPSAFDLAIVAAIILLLFGGGKLPELMRRLRSDIKDFKRGTDIELRRNEAHHQIPLLARFRTHHVILMVLLLCELAAIMFLWLAR